MRAVRACLVAFLSAQRGLAPAVSDIKQVLEVGKRNRSVGATKMNLGSSRSHSVFTITIESTMRDERGDEHVRVGKLNLVDLAGSERATKTGATGDRFKEGVKVKGAHVDVSHAWRRDALFGGAPPRRRWPALACRSTSPWRRSAT